MCGPQTTSSSYILINIYVMCHTRRIYTTCIWDDAVWLRCRTKWNIHPNANYPLTESWAPLKKITSSAKGRPSGPPSPKRRDARRQRTTLVSVSHSLAITTILIVYTYIKPREHNYYGLFYI